MHKLRISSIMRLFFKNPLCSITKNYFQHRASHVLRNQLLQRPVYQGTNFGRIISDKLKLLQTKDRLTLVPTNKIKLGWLKDWFMLNVRRNGKFLLYSCSTVLVAGGLYSYQRFAHCEGLKLSHKSRIPNNKSDHNSPHSEVSDSAFDWNLFLKLLLPDIWLLTFATFTAFVVAVVNIRLPHLIGELVNAITSLTHGNSDNETSSLDVLFNPSIKLVINYSMQAGLTFLYITLLSSFGERLAARMRTALFHSLISQDIAFFDSHKTGEMVNRLTADIQDFKSSFKQCISQGVKSMTQTVGCIFMLYLVSPKLTSVMLILVPGVVLVGSFLGSLLRRLSRRAQEQVSKATTVAEETLSNMRTVRAFAMEDKEASWYNDEVQYSKVLNEYLGAGIGIFQGLSNFAINGMTLIVLYCGGVLLDSGQITPGDLMSFLMATQTIQRSLGTLSILFGQIVRGLSSGARIFEYMKVVPLVEVKHNKVIPTGNIRGHVTFDSVSFTYPTRPNQQVLNDLSLEIGGGKVVALCGPSGSGKSTIALLLESFYDLDLGKITIDGHDIKDLDLNWLRGSLIGFINQEPVLFTGTVKDNIRYGKPDATDEEIYEAAKLANADDFIRDFPGGYDTVVGERGVTVSGGQKQRIAIARALIKNPKILILDEATSALDAESEKIVQDALEKVSEGRTVLVIAHRLSTIINADKIAVISNGKVAEVGTHNQLLARNGLYAELVGRQTTEKNKA